MKKKIFLAGHNGLVGSAVLKLLKKKKKYKIVTASKKELDLRDFKKVNDFFKKKKINATIICAAKVGGIKANYNYPVDFLYDNLLIQNNLIMNSLKNNINNLIFLGSSCIYPKKSSQPIKESYLLSGKLEETNRPYALAKITGYELCRSINRQYNKNYKCLMPANLYGPNDKYNSQNSHFLPAVIKKIYLAKQKKTKEVEFWGTGKPKRELLYVDDLARAIIFFLEKKSKSNLINIGSGYEKKIKYIIKLIAKKIKYEGKIKFNNDKFLDGTPRKIVNCSIAYRCGWKPKFSFEKGLDLTIKDFIKNKKKYLIQ